MSADQSKVAANLRRFREAVAAHDRENEDHTAWGIGLSHFDMERLGFDEGEELWPGIIVCCDKGQSANLRVLCNAPHDEGEVEAEQERVMAIAGRSIEAGETVRFGTAREVHEDGTVTVEL